MIDAMVRKHTGFKTMEEMLTAKNYRPSFYIQFKTQQEQFEVACLADHYDAEQAKRNDERRAYRGGRW